MPGIVQQIETVEGDISKCEKRLDRIERRLRLEHNTEDQRKNLEEEAKELKKKLDSNDKSLKNLRHENRRSMLLSVAILIIIYAGYYFFYKG